MHTYSALFVHVTFSTAERAPLISPAFRDQLHAYLSAVARNLGCRPIQVGGVVDHVHALIGTPPKIPVADLVSKLKSNSSRWIHESQPCLSKFAWQRGYGAFSVSPGELTMVKDYIRNQEEHHRTRTFREEYLEFLDRYGVDFDPDQFLR